jgi:crotonobetainyl-CoA:carnitine CoA-transferase CaiB-like acyl-CoA transferase
MSLTAGIGAALFARERTGKGQLVSTSLLRQGLYTISFDLNTALRFGIPIGTPTHETMGNPMINYYTDRDGQRFWLIGLEGDRHWPDLCRAVGRPEWELDERFDGAAQRARNCGELTALLDDIFVTRTRAEWGGVFDRENLWWAPVQTTDEVLADAQVAAAGGFTDVPDGAATTSMMATPVDFAGTPWASRSMAPELGEHTDEILRELGRDDAAIGELRSQQVVA